MPIIEKLGPLTFERLTPDEVEKRFERNELVLIDVRTPQEYAFEHIPGALLFPLSSFDARKLPCQQNKPIAFYCRSGKRSRTVAQQCSQIGIARVAHMEGGFNAWKDACHPHVAIDTATGAYVRKNWKEAYPPLSLVCSGKQASNTRTRFGSDKLFIPKTSGEQESLNSSLL